MKQKKPQVVMDVESVNCEISQGDKRQLQNKWES